MNTSTNFLATAFLGLAVFGETLSPIWWLGAAMLVAGNVIVGRAKEDAGLDKGECQYADAQDQQAGAAQATVDEERDRDHRAVGTKQNEDALQLDGADL